MEAKIEGTMKIFLTPEIDQKLACFTNEFDNEIGAWLGGEVKEDCIIIDDLLIPPQEVSGADVDIDPKGLIALREEYKKKCDRIIGHFHSHHKMGAFWSGTDENNMRQIMEANTRKLFVFLVTSSSGYRLRVELKVPFKVILDDLKYQILTKDSEKTKEWCQAEWDKKVKVKKYTFNESAWGGKYGVNNYGKSLASKDDWTEYGYDEAWEERLHGGNNPQTKLAGQEGNVFDDLNEDKNFETSMRGTATVDFYFHRAGNTGHITVNDKTCAEDICLILDQLGCQYSITPNKGYMEIKVKTKHGKKEFKEIKLEIKENLGL